MQASRYLEVESLHGAVTRERQCGRVIEDSGDRIVFVGAAEFHAVGGHYLHDSFSTQGVQDWRSLLM